MDKLKKLIERRNVLMYTDKSENNGKLSARERINLLFDEGSFIETDMFSGKEDCLTYEGVITGYGTVNSKLVFVYAQDSSSGGGVFTKGQAKKICKIIDMALKTGSPCISMIDSCGINLDDATDSLSAMGDVYTKTIKASGAILQIATIFGTCAGGAAYSALMSDFVIMTEKSNLLLNGPSVCAKEGEIVTIEDIGGAMANAKINGNAHFISKNDEEAVSYVKKLINLLPGSSKDKIPEEACMDDLNRLSYDLGTKEMKACEVIKSIADNGELFEVSKLYAENIITGFIKINGRTVATISNNGDLDSYACDKASRFICFADSFNIPVLTFCDVEGFKASCEEEKRGVAKYAAKLAAAYAKATVPKVTVINGNACTSAGVIMGSRSIGADFVIAWPESVIGAVSPDAASILFGVDKSKEEAKNDYIENIATSFKAAEKGVIDDITEPFATRPRVAAAFEMLYGKREDIAYKKHESLLF